MSVESAREAMERLETQVQSQEKSYEQLLNEMKKSMAWDFYHRYDKYVKA